MVERCIKNCNNIFILVFVSMFISCKINKIEGCYYQKFETLKLNPDFTYTYEYRMEWPKAISVGRWSVIGNGEILLLSYYNIDSLPISVRGNYDSTERDVIIQIIPKMDLDSIFKEDLIYEIIADGQPTEKSRFGEFKIKNLNKNFQVVIYIDSNKIATPTRARLLSEKYKINKSKENRFVVDFAIKTDFFYYDKFITDTLYVNRRGLLWKSKGNHHFKKCSEERARR